MAQRQVSTSPESINSRVITCLSVEGKQYGHKQTASLLNESKRPQQKDIVYIYRVELTPSCFLCSRKSMKTLNSKKQYQTRPIALTPFCDS